MISDKFKKEIGEYFFKLSNEVVRFNYINSGKFQNRGGLAIEFKVEKLSNAVFTMSR